MEQRSSKIITFIQIKGSIYRVYKGGLYKAEKKFFTRARAREERMIVNKS